MYARAPPLSVLCVLKLELSACYHLRQEVVSKCQCDNFHTLVGRHPHIHLSPGAQVFACLAMSSSHVVARKVQVFETICVEVDNGKGYVMTTIHLVVEECS